MSLEAMGLALFDLGARIRFIAFYNFPIVIQKCRIGMG